MGRTKERKEEKTNPTFSQQKTNNIFHSLGLSFIYLRLLLSVCPSRVIAEGRREERER